MALKRAAGSALNRLRVASAARNWPLRALLILIFFIPRFFSGASRSLLSASRNSYILPARAACTMRLSALR